MVDDERQRVLMLRADVNEVDVEAVDLGHELREGVQLRLARAPVVLRLPVAGELLHRRERHALRLIGDGLLVGPLRRRDASTEILEGIVGNVDPERADRGRVRRSSRRVGGRLDGLHVGSDAIGSRYDRRELRPP